MMCRSTTLLPLLHKAMKNMKSGIQERKDYPILVCTYSYTGIISIYTLVSSPVSWVQYFSMMLRFSLMDYSLSVQIYPIADVKVVDTLIYNGLSVVLLCRSFEVCFHRRKKSKRRTD